MKVYILDELFMNYTTEYTGEEIIVWPVELKEEELQRLEELGIVYTTDSDKVYSWIKEQEKINHRDYGGYMIRKPEYGATKLNIDWDTLKEVKEASKKDSGESKKTM